MDGYIIVTRKLMGGFLYFFFHTFHKLYYSNYMINLKLCHLLISLSFNSWFIWLNVHSSSSMLQIRAVVMLKEKQRIRGIATVQTIFWCISVYHLMCCAFIHCKIPLTGVRHHDCLSQPFLPLYMHAVDVLRSRESTKNKVNHLNQYASEIVSDSHHCYISRDDNYPILLWI